jgi:peptide chain release factor 2
MVSEVSDPKEMISGLRQRLGEARRFLDLEGKEAELEDLRERSASPDLWNDPDEARMVSQKLSRFEGLFETVDGLESQIEDAEVLLDLAAEADDADSRREAMDQLGEVASILDRLELESLFFDEYDDADAIISVHAGAGGVDAQDWAEMLARMYQRYLADKGFSVTVEEATEGEEAGIKSATMTVKGDRAYGTLESERGVHRLVRISPFDSNARRHTSFAGVDVVPDLGEAADVEIDEDDLRIDTYRSQGAGGQHVNKTDSAVRITHLADGDRRAVSERAVPAPEQDEGHGDAQGEARRAGPTGASGASRLDPGRAGGSRLGSSGAQLCAAALPDGQGPAHRS